MKKEKVLLLGASGSMGHAAFLELLKRKQPDGSLAYDIVLLQRPSAANKKIFAPYLRKPGITIYWGDATVYEDVLKAVSGVNWVLCPMALISPEADKYQEKAKAVNTTAIEYIVKAIEAQPDGAQNIKFIYTGTVAATGSRLPPIHVGRVGDPMYPSVLDYYACTKIRGELAVAESNIAHWASLRQTFIMIPDVMSLSNPIMFHQPLCSCMENNTMRDAGRGLINCLDIPDDSDFWQRAYNMGGGENCRSVYLYFLQRVYTILGIDYKKVMERNWFALGNFHMQYFEDSCILDSYIHNFGDSLEDFEKIMVHGLPFVLKIVAKLNKVFPLFRRFIEYQTYQKLKKMAEQPDGPLFWVKEKKEPQVSAFFGSISEYEKIPDWNAPLPENTSFKPYVRLEHGYDENKKQLDLQDLKMAAKFRGGECLASSWSGSMHEKLQWVCYSGHEFSMKPNTVLKLGHWCPECLAPPWKYDRISRQNYFLNQVRSLQKPFF